MREECEGSVFIKGLKRNHLGAWEGTERKGFGGFGRWHHRCAAAIPALPLPGMLQIPFLGAAGREGMQLWNSPRVEKLGIFSIISLPKGGGFCVSLTWVYEIAQC